ERDHIAFLVGEERERNDQALVALAARDCPLDESLAKQIEDPIVAGAGEVHPRINAEEGCGRFTFDLLGTQGALAEDRRKVGKSHVEAATLSGVAGAGKPREVNGGGAASRGGAGCLPAGISDARAVRGCGATDPGGRGPAVSGSTAADRRCDNPREGGGRIGGAAASRGSKSRAASCRRTPGTPYYAVTSCIRATGLRWVCASRVDAWWNSVCGRGGFSGSAAPSRPPRASCVNEPDT